MLWDWESGKLLEVGGKPNGAALVGKTGVVGMKKNCCVCGERGKLEMLGLGRLGSLYGRGELRSGAGGRLFCRYGIVVAALLLMVLLLTLTAPLLLLLLTVVMAPPPPCFNRVSMEKPKDWDLLRPKGEARGP